MKKLNDAINICLTTIGERPLGASTPITGVYEAELAEVTIEEAKTELLSKGFIFNTDTAWQLKPDNTDTIVIPYGALSVDATAASSDYIVKDNKLYNKATHDFIFTDVVTADIIWNIAFDDLPSHAQVVIVNMAKEKLYTRIVGVDETMKLLREDTIKSHSVLLGEEMRLGDYSIYDDGASNRAMTRSRNPVGL
jgi:uncharacterized protein YccT (UPF0319 family)